jgi:hypothetical protein
VVDCHENANIIVPCELRVVCAADHPLVVLNTQSFPALDHAAGWWNSRILGVVPQPVDKVRINMPCLVVFRFRCAPEGQSSANDTHSTDIRNHCRRTIRDANPAWPVDEERAADHLISGDSSELIAFFTLARFEGCSHFPP